MRLSEYLNKFYKTGEEVTVWDKDYDIETYFYFSDTFDEWDAAMYEVAESLEVVEVRNGGVIVNLSDVIERNINNGVFKDLFINNDVDSIMDDIENIFAGYVSTEWLKRFARSLV